MIRLAFLAVLFVAGLLAFGGFSLMRNTGPTPVTDAPVPVPAPLADDTAPVAEEARIYPLRDLDLTSGALAFVLHGVEGGSVVVTDAAALQAAAPDLSFAASALGASDTHFIAELYRDDVRVGAWPCPVDGCAPLTDPDTADLADITDIAQPLALIEEVLGDYTAYLDALTFVQSDPNFALLDLADAHPLDQQTPTATLALPTISRAADAPLDAETHAALLTALLTDALPDGVTVQDITVTPQGNPIVVDNDNGRPATRGGAEIPFEGVQLYDVTADLSGTGFLPSETLDALTEQTRLTVDWEEGAAAFIAALGLACTDCYAVRSKTDTVTQVEIVDSTPETYVLRYYDLREAP